MENSGLIIGTIIPVLVAVCTGIFNYINSRSNRSQKYHEIYLHKFLIPVIDLLKDTEAHDIDETMIKKLDVIFNRRPYLLPHNMISNHEELKKQFQIRKSVDAGFYKTYNQYILSEYNSTRRKLGMPSNNIFNMIKSLRKPQQLWLFFSYSLMLTLYAVTIANISVSGSIIIAIAFGIIISFLLTIPYSYSDMMYKIKEIKNKLVREKSSQNENYKEDKVNSCSDNKKDI